MRDFFLLVLLDLAAWKNRLLQVLRSKPFSSLLLALGIALFYGSFLRVSYWVLIRLLRLENIGIILTTKLIQLMLILSVGIVTMSALTTAISCYFMSRDLEFQFSLPVRFTAWLSYRQLQVLLQSCWMVLVFGGPLIALFLHLSDARPWAIAAGLLAFLLLLGMVVNLASLIAFVLVRVFPARQVHQVLLILGIILLSALVFFARYMEPEKFVGPGGMEEFRGYIDLVDPSAQAWNPAKWTGDFLTALSTKSHTPALTSGSKLLLAFVLFQVPFLSAAWRLYRRSWDRALTAMSGETPLPGKMGPLTRFWSQRIQGKRLHQVARELLLFLRDPAQWSQIFILIGLLALYLYSITRLPLAPYGGTRLQVAFANTTFVAFVGLSMSSRFLFTSFSSEGQALWLLKTAPGSWNAWVNAKLLVFGLPILLFCLLLSLGSGCLLAVGSRPLLLLGLATTWDVLLILALSASCGMLFMNPNIENPQKLIISPGGLFLMSAGLLVILGHGLLRLVSSSPILNSYFVHLGFPNLSGRAAGPWIVALILMEGLFLAVLHWRALRHLQTSEALTN